MSRIFEDEVKQLENELNALKTVYTKTASVVRVKTTEMAVQRFTLDTGLPEEVACSQALKVTVATRDDTNMLCDMVLRPAGSASGYNMNMRQVVFNKQQVGSDYIFVVDAASRNVNDINIVMGGGSVQVDYYLAVVGSSDYTIRTEWIYR